MASAGGRQTRFHGRAEARGALRSSRAARPPGEFRAPAGRGPSFDGPGDWRWLCLDHVREFNAGYNYFEGMSSDEIQAAHNPYGGWDRETRAFAHMGADGPPQMGRFPRPARRDRRPLPPRRRRRAEARRPRAERARPQVAPDPRPRHRRRPAQRSGAAMPTCSAATIPTTMAATAATRRLCRR